MPHDGLSAPIVDRALAPSSAQPMFGVVKEATQPARHQMDSKCYTLQEAANHLRISTKTLRGLLGAHPFYARTGRKIIISDADLARLYEVLRCPSDSSATQNARNIG